MMDDNERVETAASVDPELPEHPALGGNAHWTGRPLLLLAAVLAVKLFLYLAQLGMSLPVIAQSSTDADIRLNAAILQSALSTVLILLLSILFYWRVMALQNRHGIAGAVSWKPGIAFYAGIVMVLGYGVLAYYNYFQVQPVLSIVNFLSQLVGGLTGTLFLVVLLPVTERRFGIVRGALILSAAYAVLSVLQLLLSMGFSAWMSAAQGLEMVTRAMWNGILSNLLSTLLVSFAKGAVGVACYHLAARRVPGTWMLYVAVPSLVVLLNNHLPDIFSSSSRPLPLLISAAYYLLVFGLSMGILAGYQRWKTPQALKESTARLVEKLKAIQNTD